MTIDTNLVNAKLDFLKSTIQKIENMEADTESILHDEDVQDMLDRRMQAWEARG